MKHDGHNYRKVLVIRTSSDLGNRHSFGVLSQKLATKISDQTLTFRDTHLPQRKRVAPLNGVQLMINVRHVPTPAIWTLFEGGSEEDTRRQPKQAGTRHQCNLCILVLAFNDAHGFAVRCPAFAPTLVQVS